MDSLPGDIPARILKEFLPEFALPVTAILREAISTKHMARPIQEGIPPSTKEDSFPPDGRRSARNRVDKLDQQTAGEVRP